MLLLKCPHCKNNMKYAPKERAKKSNRKRCVYCGKIFDANSNILRELKSPKKKTRQRSSFESEEND
jgi:predicted  nucleic acid-binding Zn-ribbon protein